MISFRTTRPAGETGAIGLNATMLLVAPGTGWPRKSMPATLSEFVPGFKGTVAVQFVTDVQVKGHSVPLNQIVLTWSGAVPAIRATSLLTTVELITKATLLTPWLASVVRRELCIVPIQLSRPPAAAGSLIL